MRFNVLDIETTGLSYKNDDILEIGVVKFDNNIVIGRQSYFVNSPKELSIENQSVHKITPEMIKNAPKIEVVLPKVVEFCGNDPIVGHNFPSFDIHFFNRVITEKGIAGPKGEVFCSRLLAKHLFPKTPDQIINRKLITLLTHYKIEIKEPLHRAGSDCYYNGVVFLKMMKEAKFKNFEDLKGIITPVLFVKPPEQMSLF